MGSMFENSSLVSVLLVASLLVNLVTLVLVIILFRKNRAGAEAGASGKEDSGVVQAAAAVVSGIVFCRGCGNQYDSINTSCPGCNTVR